MPISTRALGVILQEVVARNRIGYGIVYLQITRGVARRDHAFPSREVRPSLVVTARALNRSRNEALAEQGIAVITVPDNRWGRVDIKTTGLLSNVLARQAAIERGARDAWFVDEDGTVTEASSANVWIVTPAGTLVTRHADHAILRHNPHRFVRCHQGTGPRCAGTSIHGRGGVQRPRSLYQLGEPDRAAGSTGRRPNDW